MKRSSHTLLVALLLAATVAVSGCSSGGSPASSAAPSSSATEQSGSSAQQSSSDAAASGEKLELTWLSSNPPLEDGSWGEQEFEKRFGVDVVIKRATSADEKSVMFGSGDIPDFIVAGNLGDVSNLVNQEVVRTFTLDMIKENAPEYYEMCINIDPNFFNYGLVDGELYGFPRMNATARAGLGAAIRADWLQNLGLAVPKTVDELTNVFDKFTHGDPDGNGQNDTYAITAGGANESSLQRVYFPSIFGIYSVNPFYWTENTEGNLEYGFVSEASKKALTLLSSWYAKGYIDPEFVTTEMRSSGTDVAYKFATGKVGYMDNVSYDDYEVDNDGHVTAKWVANQPKWQEFFASTTDTKVLFQYDVTTDFSDELDKVGPYYINLNPVSDEDGNPGKYLNEGTVATFFCFGANASDAEVAKMLQILNEEAMDEETYMLHFGPEGLQWMYDTDGKTRIYNPDYVNLPDYHPQGQKNGIGWCLFPMLFSNPDLLTAVSGDRYIQRYERTLPVFVDFPQFGNKLTAALPSSAEYPELTTTWVATNLVKLVRGDIPMDQWDSVVAEWYDQGGEVLTKEANEWYASMK